MKNEESLRRPALRSAAAKLFREVGYDKATVRDIARAVGLQSGSIFYHYETKEDILVDVMLEGMRQFAEAVKGAAPVSRTARERLRALFVAHLTALHHDRDEIAVVLSEWRALSPKSRRQIVKRRDEVDAVWNDALRAAAAEGIVGGDLRILRLSMLGAMNWSLQWYDREGALSIDALADRMLDAFVPGSKPR
jgi:TetR/AcrR family transcriptional regulator, cholesterol catabolism regulator